MEKDKIQIYLNNFRRLFSPFLKRDINFRTVVYPADNGAIVEINFKKFAPVKDEFRKNEKSLTDSLKRIEQHSFGGNLDGFQFKGTNFILEGEKIYIIKDDDSNEWTIEKAREDVFKLLNPQNPR
ncbi:MAG TPA: hypothetical protein VK172_03150 [Lentimicrobium sp.]|nr:hypothetical protein [Lentimicrobium sp.]